MVPSQIASIRTLGGLKPVLRLRSGRVDRVQTPQLDRTLGGLKPVLRLRSGRVHWVQTPQLVRTQDAGRVETCPSTPLRKGGSGAETQTGKAPGRVEPVLRLRSGRVDRVQTPQLDRTLGALNLSFDCAQEECIGCRHPDWSGPSARWNLSFDCAQEGCIGGRDPNWSGRGV